jgi:hypothetical protein
LEKTEKKEKIKKKKKKNNIKKQQYYKFTAKKRGDIYIKQNPF